MKLWHDDMRPPPDDTWVWARTNDEAKTHLRSEAVEVASLDHDLGMEEVDLRDMDIEQQIDVAIAQQERHSETGLDLVDWMVKEDLVPSIVRIHSWNPPGAQAMAARIQRYSPDTLVIVKAFGS